MCQPAPRTGERPASGLLERYAALLRPRARSTRGGRAREPRASRQPRQRRRRLAQRLVRGTVGGPR